MLKKVFNELYDDSPAVMILGGFDGLHVGHKLLVDRAKALALPIGIMTIEGGKTGKSLFTVSERESIFKRFGVDFAFELSFEEIKDMSPSAFLDLLKKECNAAAFVCGEDFRFGAGAVGTPQTLKGYALENAYVEKILYDGEKKVGATLIKEYLSAGNAKKAAELLAVPFFVQGEVVRDRGVGRTIGFPTANILYPKEKFPLKKGVYETRAVIDGKTYKGITNYGARPTFNDDTVVTETHFIAYTGDLYGKKLEIQFVDWIRENKKFESVETLKSQLTKDVGRVTKND